MDNSLIRHVNRHRTVNANRNRSYCKFLAKVSNQKNATAQEQQHWVELELEFLD